MEEQLAEALLPYLNGFDESALSSLAARLRNRHGIDVKATPVAGASNTVSKLTFAKHSISAREPSATPFDLGELDVLQQSAFNDISPRINAQSLGLTGLADTRIGAHDPTAGSLRGANSYGDQFLSSVEELHADRNSQPGWIQEPQGTSTTGAMITNRNHIGNYGGNMGFNASSLSASYGSPVGQDPVVSMGGSRIFPSSQNSNLDALSESGLELAQFEYELSPTFHESRRDMLSDQRDVPEETYEDLFPTRDGSQPDLISEHSVIDPISDHCVATPSQYNNTMTAPCARRYKKLDRVTQEQSADDPVSRGSLCDQEMSRASEIDCSPPIQRLPAELTALFGESTKDNSLAGALREVMDASDNFIRPDIVDYLEEALPRWQKAGLWVQVQLPEPLSEGTGRAKLFNAYSCLCKLEARMGDDQIRNRMALITLHSAYEEACKDWRLSRAQGGKKQDRVKRGRGDASSVIDDILERLHEDWHNGDRKAQLRSHFHDKKRYGKRWLVLTKSLGFSVLIACSAKIASLVHNTVFTAPMLEALAHCVRSLDRTSLKTLKALDPLTESVLYGNRSVAFEYESILNEIRSIVSNAP